MNTPITKSDLIPDFREKTTLWIAIIGLVILTPFSINNFIVGRFFLGVGSLAIVVILLANAFFIKRGRYYPLATQLLVVAIIFFLLFAIYKKGIIAVFWYYPALITFYFMLPERQAWLANGVLLIMAFPLGYYFLEPPLLLRMVATLIAVSAFSAIFIRIITQHQKVIELHATTDPLTGLLNRKMLYYLLEQAFQQNRRFGTQMMLLALDIDHFKKINDTYGHDAGDKVLQELANFLLKRLRSVDKVFRLGGEEFLVLLHDTDAESGIRLAEGMRSDISSLPFLNDHPMTVSIGVASLEKNDDRHSWVKRSDENLYQAKFNGRNCVVA